MARHDELHEGLHAWATYTVRQAVEDWLANGLDGGSAVTVSTYTVSRWVWRHAEPLVTVTISGSTRPTQARWR